MVNSLTCNGRNICLRTAVFVFHSMVKTISCYFPRGTDWFGFIIENRCVYCATNNKACFLIIKSIRCNNFSNLFLEQNSTCFGQFLCPSSGDFQSTHSNRHTIVNSLLSSCRQTCMTYTIVVCTVKNS